MLYHALGLAFFAAASLANPVPETAPDACATVKCGDGKVCELDDNGKAQCVAREPVVCGNVTCGEGEYCCNDSW